MITRYYLDFRSKSLLFLSLPTLFSLTCKCTLKAVLATPLDFAAADNFLSENVIIK